jgi:hypothetical protein
MPTAKITTLHCYVTEDDGRPDETVITIVGNRFEKFGPHSMNNQSDWEINVDMPFNRRCRVELWDIDLARWPDYHDKLGTHIINADQINQGPKDARFNAYGSDYRLTYEVV